MEMQRERAPMSGAFALARVYTRLRADCLPSRPSHSSAIDVEADAADGVSGARRGERLAYTISMARMDPMTGRIDTMTARSSKVPEDALEAFIDVYSVCYEMYFRRWSDGHGSIHYVRRRNTPSIVERISPRSRTRLCVDLSGLADAAPET